MIDEVKKVYKFEKVSTNAKLPNRPEGALSYDLFIDSIENVPNGILVGVGCSVEIPEGHIGLICSKWSLAQQGILVYNQPNVIHPGEVPEIKVLVNTVGNLQVGDAIAQLVILSAYYPYV